MLRPLSAAALLSFVLLGCATSFTGDPHFPDGPKGCSDKCSKDGMVMGSFVYVGEYSDACVCQPRGASGATSSAATSQSDTAGAVAATAGVVMQMRRMEEQQHAGR
jgi:hypothetical protein